MHIWKHREGIHGGGGRGGGVRRLMTVEDESLIVEGRVPFWLQAHQKATKAKVISGHLSAGRITSRKGLVQEGGGKHLLGLPVKEKQVTLHSEGTQHLACSQTLILEACLEMFREAGKKQAGWI